jgi:hypothetical protein
MLVEYSAEPTSTVAATAPETISASRRALVLIFSPFEIVTAPGGKCFHETIAKNRKVWKPPGKGVTLDNRNNFEIFPLPV